MKRRKSDKPNYIAVKFCLVLLMAVIFLFISICDAADDQTPDDDVQNDRNNIVRQAEELKLISGKSFILESDIDVERIAVGNPEIADIKAITKRQTLINPLKPGTTNLIIWFDKDSRIKTPPMVYDLVVVFDIPHIQKKIDKTASGSEVKVESAGMVLIVKGDVEDQEIMDRILTVLYCFVPPQAVKNLLRLKGPQQVQLEVKIAEVSRSEMKKIGLNWLSNRSFSGHPVGVGLFQAGDASGTLSGQAASGRVMGETGSGQAFLEGSGGMLSAAANIAPTFSDAFQIAVSVLDKDITSIISVLKGQGLARILARPTLVAMSGQKATFMVGGEFPVPKDAGDGATSIDYKQYGITLDFTPTVTGKETINIDVVTGVSDIDYSTTVASGGVIVPGVTSRGAGTSLQLKDGQSFVIAGLLKESVNSTVNKIPFLGDLPLIGVLFRSKEYVKEESELVILVTARLVRPMNKEEVPPLPGEIEDYNMGDFKFLFTGLAGGDKDKEVPSEKYSGFSGHAGFER